MKSALKKVSLILAICFVAFHLYTAAFGTMPGIAQKSIHLGFLLVIFYINAMVDSEKRWEQIFLGIMALFALGGCAYITILDENLQLRAGIVYASDILFAILLIIASLRRAAGRWAIPWSSSPWSLWPTPSWASIFPASSTSPA